MNLPQIPSDRECAPSAQVLSRLFLAAVQVGALDHELVISEPKGFVSRIDVLLDPVEN